MPKCVVVVIPNLEKVHEVLRAWEALGVPGVTMIDTIGMASLRQWVGREDLPLVPSLRSILESAEAAFHHRTLFSVVPDTFDLDRLIQKTEEILGPLDQPETGFLFVLPVLEVRGLRQP